MRKAIILTAAALAAAPAAGASEAGVVASASGGYGFTGNAAGSTFDVGPFTWNVQIHADGSVHGRFNYTQVRDGVQLTVRGSLTCAVIIDDHVWVGGVIEDSSRATLVGLDMWFQAADTGEGADAPAQQYCVDHPPVRFPFLVGQGNLQVRS